MYDSVHTTRTRLIINAKTLVTGQGYDAICNQGAKVQENGQVFRYFDEATRGRMGLAAAMMATMSEGRMCSPLGNHGAKVSRSL